MVFSLKSLKKRESDEQARSCRASATQRRSSTRTAQPVAFDHQLAGSSSWLGCARQSAGSRALRLAKQTAARKEQEARESKEKAAAAKAGGEGKKAAAAGAAAKSAKPARPFSAPSVGTSRPKAAVGKPARR